MRVGVLGGGQLGRMLALAGYPLGLEFRFLDPAADAPAGRVGELVVGGFDDAGVLERFAAGLDVVTYEFESVPVEAARTLEKRLAVHPPPEALARAQDRLLEKRLFEELGIPVAPYAAVETRSDLEAAVARLGYPCVLKTRRFGYDGKGQSRLQGPADLETAWTALGGRPLVLERWVAFTRELSIVAVRGQAGERKCYPVVENHHVDGILRRTLAPATGMAPGLAAALEDMAIRLLERLSYVGVLALELFEADGAVYANEMAPRVHNSGHWTIEGAATSQFENHVRAILGLPLGDTRALGFSGMRNLVGSLPDVRSLLALGGVKVHLYDKAPKPGRKLGHVTACAATAAARDALLLELERFC